MVKMAGNGVPGAVSQSDSTLFARFQVPWVNGAGEIRQGIGSGTQSKP
jgi:hypothetical protein